MTQLELLELVKSLRNSDVFSGKQDIQSVASELGIDFGDHGILNGDDAAAIPDGDGYLLLAAEGIISKLIKTDPHLAGRSAVVANVNDIYAMGGRPLAMVDIITNADDDLVKKLCQGMKENARRFAVPLVGGHTTHGSGEPALSLAILGRANKLLTSFDALPGDQLLQIYNPRGQWLDGFGFWNSNALRSDPDLRCDLELLPQVAEEGLAKAAKDISMAGIVGTSLMLAESSGVSVQIDLDALQPPDNVELSRWVQAFFSYGFLLAVAPEKVAEVVALFEGRGLKAVNIGEFSKGSTLQVNSSGFTAQVWDWAEDPFTGFSQ